MAAENVESLGLDPHVHVGRLVPPRRPHGAMSVQVQVSPAWRSRPTPARRRRAPGRLAYPAV